MSYTTAKQDMKHRPHPDYRYWLYDPEGNGMVYYRTKEDRDKAGAEAVAGYLDGDGWAEEIEYMTAGEVTHSAQCMDKKQRPDELDEDGYDSEGTYWGDFAWMGRYKLEPLPASPSTDTNERVDIRLRDIHTGDSTNPD